MEDTLATAPLRDLAAAFSAGALVAATLVAALLFRRSSRVRAEAIEASRRTLLGRVGEQLAPHLPGFSYDPADARFLGAPIDYVVFDGYAAGDDVEVVLVEVKTGRARLSPGEERVREAIKKGRVRFEVVRLDV